MACSNNFIQPHVKNTWFEGLQMTFTQTIDNVTSPIDLNGFGVLITLKLSETSPVVYEFKTEDNTVSITDANNGVIMLEPRGDLNAVGNYLISLFLIDVSGNLIPYFTDYFSIISVPLPPNSTTNE